MLRALAVKTDNWKDHPMATSTAMIYAILIGRVLGKIALAVAGAFLAAYAFRHFPGWAIALSLILAVCASMPLVLSLQRFSDSSDTEPKPYKFQRHDDDWDDLFSPWHRSDDD
jgi:membrane protein implicated in regulation of membrane protease activity